MKRIEILEWTVEGYGCIQDPVTYRPKHGVTFWMASNGTGKTTLISALIWGLYSKPLKEVPASDIPTYAADRKESFKGTRVHVSLILRDGRQLDIYRHISYKGKSLGYTGNNNLIIAIDGQVDTSHADKREQDAFIVSLLGVDYKTLLNSSVFGQRMQRLVESSPAAQREQFEQLFNLDWVDALGSKVKAELAELMPGLDKDKVAKEQYDALLNNAKQELAQAEDNYQQQLIEKQKKIAEMAAEVAEFEDEVNQQKDTVESAKASFDKVSSKLEAAREVVTGAKAKLSTAQATADAEAKACKKLEAELERAASVDDTIAEFEKSIASYENDVKLLLGSAPDEDLFTCTDQVTQAQQHLTKLQGEKELVTVDLRGAQALASNKTISLERLEAAMLELGDGPNLLCPTCDGPLSSEKQAYLLKAYELKKKSLEEDIAKAKEELAQQNQKVNELELRADLLVGKDIPIAKAAFTQVSEKLEQVTKWQDNLQKCNTAIDDLRAKIVSQQELGERRKQIQLHLKQAVADLKAANAEVDSATEELAVAEARLEKIKANYIQWKQYYEEVTGHYNELKAKLAQLNSNIKWEKDVAINTDLIQSLQKQIEQHGAKSAAYEADIVAKQLEVNSLELLSKACRANGIRARVIGGLLDQFNAYVNQFANKLLVNVKFSVDNTKDSLPFKVDVQVFSDGAWKPRAYAALSGGQQQRVSIATTLGLATLLDKTNPLDVLLLDEVFEGLDQDGLESAYGLLRDTTLGNKKCIVISHQPPHGLQVDIQQLSLKNGVLTVF